MKGLLLEVEAWEIEMVPEDWDLEHCHHQADLDLDQLVDCAVHFPVRLIFREIRNKWNVCIITI